MQVQQDKVISVLTDLLFRFAGIAGVVQLNTLAQRIEGQGHTVEINLVIIDQLQTGVGGQSSYGHAGISLACPVLRQDGVFVLGVMIGKHAGYVQSAVLPNAVQAEDQCQTDHQYQQTPGNHGRPACSAPEGGQIVDTDSRNQVVEHRVQRGGAGLAVGGMLVDPTVGQRMGKEETEGVEDQAGNDQP